VQRRSDEMRSYIMSPVGFVGVGGGCDILSQHQDAPHKPRQFGGEAHCRCCDKVISGSVIVLA
jgi:hypothetical protein